MKNVKLVRSGKNACLDKMFAKLIITLIMTTACNIGVASCLTQHLIGVNVMSEKQLTKKIQLTQGQFAIVDAENYEWLSKWTWYACFANNTKSYYARRNGQTKDGKQYTISMAREILGLKLSDMSQADHINHNTVDNRFVNLRIVTPQQNTFNRKNIKGYSLRKGRQKYRARIRINGKLIHLGDFNSEQKAQKAYLQAKGKYHQISYD